MTSSSRVKHISSFPQDQVLGIGRTGLVVCQGMFAIKLPLRWSTSSAEEVEGNIESLQNEQAIYHRLGDFDGIVPFLGCSSTSTTLHLMENGDLRSFLSRNENKPSRSLQLSWFRSMARALSHIHERGVIVADVATRNFLLGAELNVQICDFTGSILLPLDTCMETAGKAILSIRISGSWGL
ncbi:kinase-like domain-containing protein [Aspergillus karnatakaensis]|uniref:kinase-like domain-containing protein n=1 Tax=Aspergillus karnatakaensis TaxID=1810916 RepID=UPI003CCCA0E1